MAQQTPPATSLGLRSPTPAFDSSAIQTATLDSRPAMTGYADSFDDEDDDGNDLSNNGVLNYYFLLLAVFAIAIVVAYCSISRRRKRKLVLLRTNRQDALERDLEGWPGSRRWGHGRWRTSATQEGLDERGMPPPPYIPAAPQPAHPATNHDGERAIPLQDLHAHDQKPPDYAESTSESRGPAFTDTARPNGSVQP